MTTQNDGVSDNQGETEKAVDGDESSRWQSAVKRLFGSFNWLPLLSLFGVTIIILFSFRQGWLPTSVDGREVLGFKGELVAIAVVAGFLGSFVRVLNRAVTTGWQELSILTSVISAFMRPLAGAMLGLFILAVFASGFVAMPIGDINADVIEDISKVNAFIFVAAFVAGLIDEFVIGIVNKFIKNFSGEEQKL